MPGILGIGLSGLAAYQSAMMVTSHNLSNVNTPFYSRRDISIVEALVGAGVKIGDVRRIYDDVANESLLKSTSILGKASAFFENIGDLEKILDNDNTNLNRYLSDSLKAIEELSASVDSAQSRDAFLSRLNNLAKQVKALGGDLQTRKNTLHNTVNNEVNQINQIVQQIKSVNEKIINESADAQDGLKDQRNALVHELAGYMQIKTEEDEFGVLNIYMTNGLDILNNNQAKEFSVSADPSDPSKQLIYLSRNSSVSEVTAYLGEGKLQGYLDFEKQALDEIERGVGRMALVLAQEFNNLNKLGIDANGDLGQNLFNDINASALLVSRVYPNANNSASATMSVNITDAKQLLNTDYKITFSSATDYTVTKISDKSVVTTGTIGGFPEVISVDGADITISAGSFAAGDSFVIKPADSALQTTALSIASSKLLAMGFPVSAQPNQSNRGDGKISVSEITDTTTSAFSVPNQLNPPIRIEFLSDTSYQLVNATTSAVIEGPIAYDPNMENQIFPTPGAYDPGFRVVLTGLIKSGDEFNVDYNANPSGDNRNALKFAELFSQKLIEGKYSLNDAYNVVTGDISLKTSTASVEYDSSKRLYDAAELRYNQISGVSDMEEMGNLVQYQQGYQASAQIIQAARESFETILGLVR